MVFWWNERNGLWDPYLGHFTFDCISDIFCCHSISFFSTYNDRALFCFINVAAWINYNWWPTFLLKTASIQHHWLEQRLTNKSRKITNIVFKKLVMKQLFTILIRLTQIVLDLYFRHSQRPPNVHDHSVRYITSLAPPKGPPVHPVFDIFFRVWIFLVQGLKVNSKP